MIAALLVTSATLAGAGDGAIQPMRVCQVLQDAAKYDGKVVAVVGRYSFRRNSRSLSEQNCGPVQDTDHASPQNSLAVVFDRSLAPRTPDHLEVESTILAKLLKAVQEKTALAKFRFGTPDYDRWAVIYGRVEMKPPHAADQPQIVCAGDSVVMFLVDRY